MWGSLSPRKNRDLVIFLRHATREARAHPWASVAITAYFLLFGVGVGMWAWANVAFDPSVEAGVAAGAGLVAYLLVGINAWFLRTIRLEVALNQRIARRAATPYVRVGEVTRDGDRFTLINQGSGLAREIQVWRIVVKAGGDTASAEFQFGRMAVLEPVEMNPPPKWRPLTQIASSAVRGDSAVGGEFWRISCLDELAAPAVRWFRFWRDQDEDNMFEELPGGVYPGGILLPGAETDPIVTALERLLPDSPIRE